MESVENVESNVIDGDDVAEMVENVYKDECIDAKNVRQREDFTSEIYKIEISNMGNFGYGVSTFCCVNKSFQLKFVYLPLHTLITGNKEIAQGKAQIESIEDQNAK